VGRYPGDRFERRNFYLYAYSYDHAHAHDHANTDSYANADTLAYNHFNGNPLCYSYRDTHSNEYALIKSRHSD
jgi:hypothetical protein